MKAVIVYREASETARSVEEFLTEFNRRTGKTIETISPDTRDGAAFCQTYDVVEYPTILALDDDGKLLQVWRGLPLPLINEVSYYAAS